MPIFLFAMFLVSTTEAASETCSPTNPDCGLRSLYLLLSLNDLKPDLERIFSSLPPRDPLGYSITELANASRKNGLRLQAIRLEKSAYSIDRPIIAQYQRGDSGHYIVIKPVGESGKLIQILDPPFAPKISTIEKITRSPGWTGRALVPIAWWETRTSRISFQLSLASIIILSVVSIMYSQRKNQGLNSSES